MCKESKVSICGKKITVHQRERERWGKLSEPLRCPVGGMSEGSWAFLLIFHSLIFSLPSFSVHPSNFHGWICSLQQGREGERERHRETERRMQQTNRDLIQVSESKGTDQLLGEGRDCTTSDSVARCDIPNTSGNQRR